MTTPTVRLLEAQVADAGRFRQALTPAEKARAGRYRQAADRDRSTVSSGLLRQAAGGGVGRFCRRCGKLGDHGQPVPLDGDGRRVAGMSLSAAHSDRAVLVAACSHALVGIDLEALALAKGWSGADREAFDQVALSDHERESLAVLSTECADGARLRAWVRKEAVLKATGLGLAVPPRGLEFSDAAPDAGAAGAVLRSWPAELDPFCSGPVAVVDFAPRAPGYVAAVAVLGASRCAIVPEAVSDPIPLASNPIPLPLEAL